MRASPQWSRKLACGRVVVALARVLDAAVVPMLRVILNISMQSMRRALFWASGVLFLSVPAGAGQSAAPITASGASPLIRTDDVTNFYRIYDAAGGHPSADQLQREYLDV